MAAASRNPYNSLLAAPVQFDPPARAKDFDVAGTASRVHMRGTAPNQNQLNHRGMNGNKV
jgi:hypothetical protein